VALQTQWLQQQLVAQQLSWIIRIAQRCRNTAVALDALQLQAAAAAVLQRQQHQGAAFACWQTAGQGLL
jgi:hypothetical protein